MAQLLDKKWLEEHLTELLPWQQYAFLSYKEMMSEKNNFPCIPARTGYQHHHQRLGFISDPSGHKASAELADLLKQYSLISRSCGKYSSLIVFFDSSENKEITWYSTLFWSLLNRVTSLDEIKWPPHVPKDTQHPLWEFCFHGEPYFVFGASPAHELRKSRSFPCFLIAFQPRWVFEALNSSARVRLQEVIRARLSEYDAIPVHPDLQTYGKQDNYEWKQYFLRDDQKSPSKCPFHVDNGVRSLVHKKG